MSYSDNLDNEKAPSHKKLLPEGWRTFQIKSGKESTSKAGNSMFVLTIEDQDTKYQEDIYIVRTEGKRWLLKQILEAVGIERKEDGKFEYDLSDLLNKDIDGEVVHEPNEFINRQGQTIKTTQHKIVGFKDHSANPGGVDNVSDIAWEQ